MKIQISELENIMTNALVKYGMPEEDAKIIAAEYLDGELRGRKSHGISSFPNAIKRVEIALKNKFEIVKEDDCYALINGNAHYGQLVGNYAMKLAIKKAREKGIAMVGFYNTSSYLMPGTFARQAVEADMIGIVIDNARSAVAPAGGMDPSHGTNPIGIGIPGKKPIVVDMATSVRAGREKAVAKQLGIPLPDNYAIDEDGNLTRDVNEVNALLPMGGYKGYCLGVAFEVLAGALINAKMGKEMKEKLDRGFLFIAINPNNFRNIEEFKKEVGVFAEEIKACRKAPEVKEIFLPGEHSERVKQDNLKNGTVEIADTLLEEIKSL
ncbi:Ldh family oxidoreductase [archaeon]|nr:Ldh family oxidoreductase [archaeon]